MMGSIKSLDEDNILKWIISADQAAFTGKLTFAQEIEASAHDADLARSYLGVVQNPVTNVQIANPSNSHLDFDLVKTWITACHNHNECGPDGISDLERFRVIDCEQRRVLDAPDNCVFVALSYLWGPLPESAHQPLPAKQIPTIEDAISTTLRLGFQYLWVDRYCIDQSSVMDRALQVKQMGQIYASAHLTIIAAVGTDPTYGLPGVSRPREHPGNRTEQVGPVTLVQLMTQTAQDVQSSTWATRGWTFQEGILSKRRLVFTEQAVLYICKQDYVHDLSPHYNSGLNYELLPLAEMFSCARLPREIRASSGSAAFKESLRYITAYSRRSLRFSEDALNAIVGILNYLSLHEKEPIYHIWGVPLARFMYKDDDSDFGVHKEGFQFALNWVHTRPCLRRVAFPSWSPLGWDGHIEFPAQYLDVMVGDMNFDVRLHREGDPKELRTEIARGQIEYAGKGAIDTRLEILNPLIHPVHIARQDSGWGLEIRDPSNWAEPVLSMKDGIEVYWDEEMHTGAVSEAKFVLWLIGRRKTRKSRSNCIVLKQVDGGNYERAGFADWQGGSISWKKLDRLILV